MKIKKKKLKFVKFEVLLIEYLNDKLQLICGKIRYLNCAGLHCNGVLFILCILKLYNEITLFCEKYNIFIDLNDAILNKYAAKVLDVYVHVIERHKYLCKEIPNQVINGICNDYNCQYNQRHRNIENECKYVKTSKILDDIHANILHYNHNITHSNTKHNKFITELNNMETYDVGVPFDLYGFQHRILRVKSKYGGLKQEITQNDIYKIHYLIWNTHYDKSIKLSKMESIKSLTAKTDLLQTNITDIYQGTVITQPHILAIILYTDNDSLCHNFRKAFRCFDDNGNDIGLQDTYDNMSEYANWIKLLFECVSVYGNIHTDFGAEYYHGLNKTFIFKRFVFVSHMPMSTSTEVAVANNFMGSNGGMVITFKNQYKMGNHCFPVKRFSSYSYEEEVLFFANYFVITGIHIDFQIENKSFANILTPCYLLLNAILHGERFNVCMNYDDTEYLLSMKNQKQLIKFIKYVIYDNSETNKYYEYFMLALKKSLQNALNHVWINKDYILKAINSNDLCDELVSLLFDNQQIQKLNPGIFFYQIEKLFLKNDYLLYNKSCDSVTIKFNINTIDTLIYRYQYMISFGNGNQLSLWIFFYFVVEHGTLYLMLGHNETNYGPGFLIFVECNAMDIYSKHPFQQTFTGPRMKISDASLIPQENLNFTLSLIVWQLFLSEHDIYHPYDHLFGMCCVYTQSICITEY